MEDRAVGRMVISGRIDASGKVTVDERPDHLSDADLKAICSSIERDIADGYSGGRLTKPMEWFELLGVPNRLGFNILLSVSR